MRAAVRASPSQIMPAMLVDDENASRLFHSPTSVRRSRIPYRTCRTTTHTRRHRSRRSGIAQMFPRATLCRVDHSPAVAVAEIDARGTSPPGGEDSLKESGHAVL
jgi:hypothetical protein